MDTTDKNITVDTNLYQDKIIIELGRALPYLHIFATAITENEVGSEVVMSYELKQVRYDEDSAYDDEPFVPNKSLPGLFTIGVSMLGGDDVLAPDHAGTDLLQSILDIATNGSVKYYRDINSDQRGIKNHINDAKILRLHCAFSHHIFLSDDVSFFGRPGSVKRKLLEELCETRILTGNEFKQEFMTRIPKGSYIHDMVN